MHLRRTLGAAAAVALLAACSETPSAPLAPSLAGASTQSLEVTSSASDGVGSLRQAIETANAGTVHRIRIAAGLAPIVLDAPLVYTGSQPLTIQGRNAVIDGSSLPDGSATPALDAALVANGGGDLTISGLRVTGSSGNGILVDVPGSRAGVQRVTFDGVVVDGSVRHGVLVNDQAEYFDDPFTRNGDGSPADISVVVRTSRMDANGFGGLDYDGIRINEGGLGTLYATISHSEFVNNGADGIELDERSEGDVRFTVRQTTINANGAFSSEDYDDGIDVDELGTGDLIGEFVHVTASANYEQGIDLNENNEGDLRVTMNQVVAEDNPEEGIEFEEDDDFEDFPEESWGGSVDVHLSNVSAHRNGERDGDAGLKVREKFTGDLVARILNAAASDNFVSGIQVREGQGGAMDAEIVGASTHDNDGAGINLRGNGAAGITAHDASGNAEGNVEAEDGIGL